MERPAKTEDITPQVIAFLRHDPGPSGEQAAAIPGMTVSLRNGGDLTASRHVQTFDGCHPYEYDESTDHARFAVQSLLVSRRSSGVFQTREIRTAAGLIPADDETLAQYRFAVPQERPRPLTDNETAFRQILGHLTFLADQPVEQMIGYQSRLLASAADPLGQPVAVPVRSEYGRAQPLQDIPVSRLSLFTPLDDTKQIGLTVCESYAPEQTLDFVPFDAVRLTFERLANQPAAVLRKALAASRDGGNSEKLADTIKQYDQLDKTGYQVVPQVYRSNDRMFSFTSRAFLGRYEDETVTAVRPLQRTEYASAFRADRLVVEPVSGQLYLVDRTSGVALSAQDAEVLDDTRAQEAVYSRGLWLR